MALTFIGQSVASAIIGNLVNKCLSCLEAYPVLRGVQDELERLQNALPLVEAVLTAVEECALTIMQNKGMDRWLWQLRDAVENAEDVLDELEYYELEKIVQNRDDKVRGILSKFRTKVDSFVNCIFSDDTLKQLREAVKVLDNVVDRMGPFLQIATGLYGPSIKRQKLEEVKNSRETSSFLTEIEVLGRDKERDTIVEWLIKPVDGESEGITFNVSAYSIVGMGGLGKTTLAQLIHQDERVQRYFDSIMWVCVSQDFNAIVATRKMLEAINHGSYGDMHYLNTLQEDLKKKLTLKRFLLILDDVWNDDDMMEWEKLVAPLKFGQRGSKILLTTRMDSVADMAAKVMKCKWESLNLNELEESDCMSLFNKHVFLGVNPDDYKNLQPIGEQIVKKLGGCPLAIKVMGGLLNSCKDYEYWKRILKEDTMKLQQGKYGIMTVLRLSYDHLPTNLRVCFRYCSIFPQDYEFKRKELVKMWMGSGLIPQFICERQRSPEDIGKEYLNLLTKKSFFICKTKYFGHKKCYVMHDLLHDLAQSVSLGECIRIRGDVVGNTIPRTVRHLSFVTTNLFSIEEIPNLKNLRTLVISDEGEHWHNEDYSPVFINKVIKGFKNLRLLSLSVNFEYNKLHDALDSLIHLRYLSISSYSSYFTTYESFHFQSPYRLYHLVVMKLSFDGIPPMNIECDGLTNLVNLRSLDLPNDVIVNIPYLSKLPFIRKLEEFFVREKSGYKISELKSLRDLRGHLCIRKLENVRSSEEAMEAKLNKKEYLKSLSLHWYRDRSSYVEVDEQLLENLCPHINLKRLCIEGYQGVKSPYWMTDPSRINLTFIKLSGCKGWEHLPPLGGLPSLNDLHMTRLHAVKQIGSSFYGCGGGCAFPSLKNLNFRDMPNLEEWIGIDDCCMFPKLHTMEIINCHNLSGLPTLPCSLRKLHIFNVGLITLPAINENGGNNNQQKQFSDPETTTLIIENCEKLQYLPTEFFQKFNTIEVLTIINCSKLEEWIGIDDCCMFPKLHTMEISGCPNLRGLPALPQCLNKLQIKDVGLTTLPAINENCGNNNQKQFSDPETTLIIEDCEKLQYLPTEFFQKFNTIKVLTIRNCLKLEEWIGIDDGYMFSKLYTMRIIGCPNLSILPTLPCSLRDLHISNVGLTTLPAINEDCRNNNQEQFLALETLTIEKCKKLQYLPTELLQKFNNLKVLRIEDCPKWTIRGISNIQQPSILDERTIGSCGDLEVILLCLANLVSLTISGLHAVKKIDSSFFGSSRGCAFPLLNNLKFTDLPNLEEWIGIDDCCMFPKLHTMEITDCPNLSGLPTLPCSLRELRIYNAGLTALQVINQDCGNNNQEYFKDLESLQIEQCEKLEYIPTLPRSLRELRIYNAGLTALHVINQDCGNNNQEYFKALERLYIRQCEKLECVPPEFFRKSNPLRELNISGCLKLTTRGISDIQLPSTLHHISIGSCGDLEEPLLQLLPNLASFTWQELCDCASITSLPTAQVCARWTMLSCLVIKNCKELSSLGGIQALVSLRRLIIRGCDKLIEVARLEAPFPNDVGQENAADCFLKLRELSIDHHALLLMEPLRSLSSISDFILFNASQLTSLPEEWLLQNHSALKGLSIRNAVSLQSLPQSMTQLCSLESLIVGNAKLIRSLPDLPTSLHILRITGCHPELKERCQENIGLDWPKIASIPDVDVRIELKYSKYR